MSNDLIPASSPEFQGAEPGQAAPPTSSANQLERFLVALRKFWWIPLITIALGAGFGLLLAARLVPVYVSSARMWETLKVQVPGESLYADDVQTMMGTQIHILQGQKMRDMALERLEANTNSSAIPLGKDGQPLEVAIQVNVIPNSSIFAIEASGPDPIYVQNYLNALMDSFITYDRDMRNNISGMTLASITDEIASLEQDLKAEQDALMTYERTNNVQILQNEQIVAGTYYEKLQTELADLQLKAKLLETAEKQHEQVAAGGTNDEVSLAVINSLESGSTVATVGSVSPADSGLDLLKIQRAELAKTLSTNSEKLAELDDQIKQEEQAQEVREMANAKSTSDQLAAYRLVTQIKISHDLDSIKEWRDKITQANLILSEADRLKFNIQRTQGEYDRLTQMSENIGISRSIDQGSLAILDRASSAYHSKAAEKKTLSLGIFAGLASGFGLVFLIGFRDDRFNSLRDVNHVLGDAVLGMLPKVNQESDGVPLLLQPNDPRHIYAESYRSLRSALHFLTTGDLHPKSILISSATPNEGKSTVSANLAQTLAMSGSRVLLVDADLRRGGLHKLLGLKNELGLAELLGGNCEPEQVLEQWRRDYDYVLLDSSPVFAAADSSALAPRVDGTIFLVRSHFSSARLTREALEMLTQRRARILGVVFNMADTKAHDYKYYNYSEYYPDAQDGA
jgi:Mrp family chromosome partitioning ATPase/uncharacterized protein involved in exopolysaccharide biosynthesis